MANGGAVAEMVESEPALLEAVVDENPASRREDDSSLILLSDIDKLVGLGFSVREAIAEGEDFLKTLNESGFNLISSRNGNGREQSYVLRGLSLKEYALHLKEIGLRNGRRDADVRIVFQLGYTVRSPRGDSLEYCGCRVDQQDSRTEAWRGIANVVTHLTCHELPFAEAVPYLIKLSKREGLQWWTPLEGHLTTSEATFEYQTERRQEEPNFFIRHYGDSFAEMIAKLGFHTSDRGAYGGIASAMQETLRALHTSAAVDVALRDVSTYLTVTYSKQGQSPELVELEIALQIPFKDKATAQIYRRTPGASFAPSNGNGHRGVFLPTNGAAHPAEVL